MKLNFGCGNDIKKGWINADMQEGKSVDTVFDFDNIPYPYGDNVFDYILCKQVLYYMDKPSLTLKELWRIAKPKAIIEIEFPHYTNRGAYVDLDVKHYWDERAFETFIDQGYYTNKRKLFNIKNIDVHRKYIFKKTKVNVFLEVVK